MSQRRSIKLVFSNSKPVSPQRALPLNPLRLLPVNLSNCPPLALKAQRLHDTRPDLAAAVERVLDRLLEDAG